MSQTMEECVKALEGAFKGKVRAGITKALPGMPQEARFVVQVVPRTRDADGTSLALSFPLAGLDAQSVISRFKKQNEDRMKERSKLKGAG